MKTFTRATAAFAAAAAAFTIGGAVFTATASANPNPDMTHGNKVSPTVTASPDTVCTSQIGKPHASQTRGAPCRH